MSDEPIPESDLVAGACHPRDCRSLLGQDAAERQFLDAWSTGRLHHAWLLRGPKGIGKASFAYRVARAVLAQPSAEARLFADESPVPGDLNVPVNCPVQSQISAQSEPRLFVLRRQWDLDRKRFQTQITVDNVRDLRRFLQLSATDGGWRVVIVDPADEMNRNAANALLKYLEEPPADTLFLLVCHSPAGLLPTIRSRCRTLDFTPLEPQLLAAAIAASGAEIPTEHQSAISELSAGSVGQALELIQGDGLNLYQDLIALMGRGDRIDRTAMLALAGSVAGTAAATRYRSLMSMVQVLIGRFARAGAIGEIPVEAAPGEAKLMQALAATQHQGVIWADLLGTLAPKITHALAVNLDPQQCVIDTTLKIDAVMSRVGKAAA